MQQRFPKLEVPHNLFMKIHTRKWLVMLSSRYSGGHGSKRENSPPDFLTNQTENDNNNNGYDNNGRIRRKRFLRVVERGERESICELRSQPLLGDGWVNCLLLLCNSEAIPGSEQLEAWNLLWLTRLAFRLFVVLSSATEQSRFRNETIRLVTKRCASLWRLFIYLWINFKIVYVF